MPLPPKVESATVRYEDGSFLSVRRNDEGDLSYLYWSERDGEGKRRIVAQNPDVDGMWAALIAVAVMAQVAHEQGDGDE